MGAVYIDESNYQDVEGILFDKDGTVIDFMLWMHWIESFAEKLNQKTEVYYDKQFLENSLGYLETERVWDPKGPLAIGSLQDLLTILSLALYQQDIPWNQAYQIVNDVNQEMEATFNFNEYLKPISGLIEFLDRAHNHDLKMGIVTSDNRDKAVQHLDALGIRKYFTSVIGHDTATRGKPYPDMVYESCQQLGVRPEKAMIFGDSNGDMMLGKKSGLLASVGIIPDVNSSRAHLEDANHIISNYDSVTLKKSKLHKE